jgi:hypothetical protein
VKLEVEACPSGVPFGDAACTTSVGSTWHDLFPSGGPAPQRLLRRRVGGLDGNTLYRWRARVLYAPFFVMRVVITPPPNPAHGPWRRYLGQVMEADIRTDPYTIFLPVVLKAAP